MARIRLDFFSESLVMGTTVEVIVPQREEERPLRDPLPVLYLLHGLSDDQTMWSRFTSIERYANEAGLAVVMPGVARSFYANEAHGLRYWDFLTVDLPAAIEEFLSLTHDPSRTFVAGLSMGGYGAMKWALRQPERFAAAASLSGVLDPRPLFATGERDALVRRVFDGIVADADDPMSLLAAADLATLPRLFVACGTEDELVSGNEAFCALAASRGIDVHTDFRPGGHEWELWDSVIAEVVTWLTSRLLDSPA